MPIAINDVVARRLETEQVIWLTTVRTDGTPVPIPVWFYWNSDTFLIYTEPGSHKLRHIARHPAVSLNFNTDESGGSVVVFSGVAAVDDHAPSPAEERAYFAKYDEGIKMIGLTTESMAQQFSTVLRVRPSRVRTLD